LTNEHINSRQFIGGALTRILVLSDNSTVSVW